MEEGETDEILEINTPKSKYHRSSPNISSNGSTPTTARRGSTMATGKATDYLIRVGLYAFTFIYFHDILFDILTQIWGAVKLILANDTSLPEKVHPSSGREEDKSFWK
jgi:hypothetical protein